MEMKSVIEAILQRHGLLETFNTSQDFHLKIENSPWMPLVIERHGDEISVAHYGELNGDLIRDPELTFSLSSDWTPTSITQDPVGRYAEVFPIVDGQQMVRPKLLRELKSFAGLWARNLKEQGFTSDDVVATSLTHASLLTPAAACRRDGVPRARRPRR
jgi:hypothetical protein